MQTPTAALTAPTVFTTAATKADEFYTDEQRAAHKRAYEDMLIARLEAGLPMPTLDKRDARRLKRERAKAGA